MTNVENRKMPSQTAWKWFRAAGFVALLCLASTLLAAEGEPAAPVEANAAAARYSAVQR